MSKLLNLPDCAWFRESINFLAYLKTLLKHDCKSTPIPVFNSFTPSETFYLLKVRCMCFSVEKLNSDLELHGEENRSGIHGI